MSRDLITYYLLHLLAAGLICNHLRKNIRKLGLTGSGLASGLQAFGPFDPQTLDSGNQCAGLETQQFRGAPRPVNLPVGPLESGQNIIALALPKLQIA